MADLFVSGTPSNIQQRHINYDIAFYEIEKQAEFSARECRQNYNDRYFLDIHFKNFNPYFISQFCNWTEESIGNLAFIALHTSFPDISEKCYAGLAAYQLYLYDSGIVV